MIPALVLTAGLATRLRPLSLVRAKAAMPVGGEPLVRRILRWLNASDVTDVVLNLHYLPESIVRHVGDGSDLGLRVRYSWEVPLLGSAGGPRLATPLLAAGTFLVVNGDTLTDVPLPPLIDEHRRSRALVTMAATAHAVPGRYGGIVTDEGGAITGFVGRHAPTASRHFVGVQVVEAEAFAAVAYGARAESVAEVYPALMRAHPGSVRVHQTQAEFFDIGTPADYLQTSLAFAARDGVPTVAGRGTQIDATAQVRASILWDDVVVGPDARVHRSVITDGVHVPAGAAWDGLMARRASGTALAAGERREGDVALSRLEGGA